MKVLIKKFSLVRDGVTYNAGSVVDLPDKEALRLTGEAAKEFALLEEVMKTEDEMPAKASAEKKKANKKGAPKSETDDAVEAIDGLPAVDAGALVR